MKPIALVLGFSIHGLAVARALHACGIPVHAVSESADLPTCKTSYATIHVDDRLKSGRVIEMLREFRQTFPMDRDIVLFPTNDKVVGQLAERWNDLEDSYLLSWSGSRDRVREIIRKDGFAKFVEQNRLAAPRSLILNDVEDVAVALPGFTAPVIVKPVVPLGTFKALRYETIDDATADSHRWQPEFPVIVQEWIDGGDTDLLFASFLIEKGTITAEFSGRKILSSPRTLGQGVVVEHFRNEQVLAEGRLIAEALDVSGPVAVEFKRGADGKLWLIEANVGRTEYSVDLLIASGVNLPKLEYDLVTGKSQSKKCVPDVERITWIDTEKEPLALLYYFTYAWRQRQPIGRLVFPFFGHRDIGPLIAATIKTMQRSISAVGRRVANVLGGFGRALRTSD